MCYAGCAKQVEDALLGECAKYNFPSPEIIYTTFCNKKNVGVFFHGRCSEANRFNFILFLVFLFLECILINSLYYTSRLNAIVACVWHYYSGILIYCHALFYLLVIVECKLTDLCIMCLTHRTSYFNLSSITFFLLYTCLCEIKIYKRKSADLVCKHMSVCRVNV